MYPIRHTHARMHARTHNPGRGVLNMVKYARSPPPRVAQQEALRRTRRTFSVTQFPVRTLEAGGSVSVLAVWCRIRGFTGSPQVYRVPGGPPGHGSGLGADV